MTTIKPAVDLAARAVVAARAEELFRASGALREGREAAQGVGHLRPQVHRAHPLGQESEELRLVDEADGELADVAHADRPIGLFARDNCLGLHFRARALAPLRTRLRRPSK